MNVGRLVGILSLAVLVSSSAAKAQDMEAELGVLGGYGFNDLYRLGLGVTAGVSVPNLYFGVRFVDHFGEATEVRRGSQVNTTDLGTLIIAGELAYRVSAENIDFRLFANVGAARYRQDITVQPDNGTPTMTSETATELLVTPGAVAFLILQGLKIGVEVQYLNAGSPAFSEDVNTRGVAGYVRFVIPIQG